jgi:hypothetical protein
MTILYALLGLALLCMLGKLLFGKRDIVWAILFTIVGMACGSRFGGILGALLFGLLAFAYALFRVSQTDHSSETMGEESAAVTDVEQLPSADEE